MPTLPVKPEWERINWSADESLSVDRERNVILGVIVAEEGPFKTPGRGEFDKASLQTIARMMREKPGGLKSRWTHPTLSSDGLGKFLGRFHNPKNVKIQRKLGDGLTREVSAVRADLHLHPTSFNTPSGNLGQYVMDLAASDPDAFGTSLVLRHTEEVRLDKKGRQLADDEGNPLPPLWRPTTLHALDVVDTGDATNSFLSSVDGLPDEVVRQAAALLEQQFGNQPREVVESRLHAWVDNWLSFRYGGPVAEADEDEVVDETDTLSEPEPQNGRTVGHVRRFVEAMKAKE